MSVSAEADVSSPLSDGQSTLDPTISKSSSESQSLKTEDIVVGQDVKSEPGTPKATPMAFVIDFGEAKALDNRRLEELAKKSQARHQRVQSMSASLTRTSPAAQRPPMSAKLPRKAQGYNSEGYFSSDQEDSGLSSSLKHRAQKIPSPANNRNIKSPLSDSLHHKQVSKSPIVDSIMSRSDNFTLNPRHGLNLPLKTSSYVKDVHYQSKVMADFVDSPMLLTDISSPELDILTPDNGLSTPDVKSPMRKSRASSETPDLFKKCIVEPLYIDDDVDRESNSSTGTYTIERDNYTAEQKARMSIDRNFAAAALKDSLKSKPSADPELIFDLPDRVITKEPRRDTALRSPNASSQPFDMPKVSQDKNVLEISCCYESPTENDLAVQTSKQIKSTRSYLEKIKNRVRTITEKTFAKSPPKHDDDESDIGSFTSVTTSGVLSSKYPSYVKSVTTSGVLSKHHAKAEIPVRRRCSLAKSEIDQTDYVHRLARESSVPVSDYRLRGSSVPIPDYMQRLTRESSVPVSLPSTKSPFDDTKFESTALRNAQKALRDDSGVSSDVTPEQVVGKMSYLSLNRCKGDKTWIQDWADSVKKYNNNVLKDDVDDRPPVSPRNLPGRSKFLIYKFFYCSQP